MAEIGNYESMKTAAIALLLQSGGSVEMPFDTLGEASRAVKVGDVTVAVERTATGIRDFITEASLAKALKGCAMSETRDFHLGDILTVTTGCLVSPSHMDGVYRILNGEAEVLAWLAEQVKIFGETRPVARLHPDDHTRIDPFTEIRKIAPQLEVITVEMPERSDDA